MIITGCIVNNTATQAQCNEHTAAAITAVANALAENAKAAGLLASALKGPDVRFGPGINVTAPESYR